MKRKILITTLILIILAAFGFSFIYWQKYLKTVPETSISTPASQLKEATSGGGESGGYPLIKDKSKIPSVPRSNRR